ncbi:MAG: hypothetical protein AAGG01_06190, partial [Planctomycetota bacterium]
MAVRSFRMEEADRDVIDASMHGRTDPQDREGMGSLVDETAPERTEAQATSGSSRPEASHGADVKAESGPIAASGLPFAGRLVDVRGNEPVPLAELRFIGRADSETIRTDASGDFTTERRYSAGRYWVSLLESGQDDGVAIEHVEAAAGEEGDRRGDRLDVAVPLGPTVPLDLALP